MNSNELLKKWFSTDNLDHPGLKSLMRRGKYFISGKITSPQFSNFTFQRFEVVPKKSKRINIYQRLAYDYWFSHKEYTTSRTHFYSERGNKKNADGLMLSPVVGLKKKGDFKNDFLIESYSEILRSKVHIKIFFVALIYIQDMQG